MKKTVFLLVSLMLTFGAVALAESIYWTAPATFANGTAITAAEKATITYYVRIDKSNPAGTTAQNGYYYLGEARNGLTQWPADNALGTLLRGYGFSGQVINFTVSAAFKDTDGIERDGAPSAPYAWTVPIPFSPRTPAAPTGPVIR